MQEKAREGIRGLIDSFSDENFRKINFRVWLSYNSQTLFVLDKILLYKSFMEFCQKKLLLEYLISKIVAF